MSKASGDRGEALVADYLRAHGYELLGAQFRCRMGEIDLIARKKGVLCFVEVKLRSSTAYGLPREFVTPSKQRKLLAAAEQYMALNELDLPTRFDVAEVYEQDGGKPKIEYIEEAFAGKL